SIMVEYPHGGVSNCSSTNSIEDVNVPISASGRLAKQDAEMLTSCHLSDRLWCADRTTVHKKNYSSIEVWRGWLCKPSTVGICLGTDCTVDGGLEDRRVVGLLR